MTFLSRSKILLNDAERPVRATGAAFVVELLEDRVLLSKGHDGPGMLDDHGGVDSQAAAFARQQVVQVKVADLVADGLAGAIEGLPVRDGQVQAIRTGDVLQIGNAFYQYASGQGYPLVPVSGPALPKDVGVPRGAVPVLLPMTEPASAMVSTPAAVSPNGTAPEVAVASPVVPVATESAPAPMSEAISQPAAPVSTSGATVAQPVAAIAATSDAAMPSVPDATISAPSAAAAPAAPAVAATLEAAMPSVPAAASVPVQTSAAVPAGSASAPAGVTSAASSAPAGSTDDTDSEHDPAAATSTSATTQAGAVPVAATVIAAGLTSTVAPAVQATPATTSSPPANGPSLPGSGNLPPASVAVDDRSSPARRGSDGQAGASADDGPAVAEVPSAAISPAGDEGPSIDSDEAGPIRPRNSGQEIADTVDGEAEAVRPVEADDNDGEASEDGELLQGLAPFIVGSVACLAWGNYVHSANPAGRRDGRESEDEAAPESD